MSEDRNNIKIGQILDRNVMPQIDNPEGFRDYLKSNQVKSRKRLIDGSDLMSSQLNFDNEKIEAMMMNPTNKMMVISNDGHVMDGHHRWIANQQMGRKCLVLQAELPILELIKTANDYNNQLNEEANPHDHGELNHEKFGPMLDTFVQFASKRLGIKSLPSMKLEKEPMTTSFGGYNPSEKSIVVISKNRHPMDIYRTVAHELVHHKQNEDGRLGKDIAKEGATGSDIENEANSEAGKIMRWFAKSNPKMFKSGYVTEGMTTSGGIRGLGNVTGEVSPSTVSQYVLDNQNYQHPQLQDNTTQGLYSFDDDNYWLDKDGSKKYKSKFIDKITKNTNLTNNYRKMFKSGYVTKSYIEEGLQDTGKMKAVFLAGGPGSGKDFIMKKTLEGHGLTEINSDNAFEHLMRMQGLDPMMPKEQDYERNLARGAAKRLTKEKERLALAGRRGVIINGTADDPDRISQVKKQLENIGYETKMLFVNTNDQVSKQRNFERGLKGGRKVPDGTDKKGIPDGSPDIRSEKWEGAQRARGPLRKMFGDQHYIELDNSDDYKTVDDKRKKEIDQQHKDLFKHYRQFVSTPAATSRAAGWIKKEKQRRKIKKYAPARATSVSQRPNVKYEPNASELEQAKILGVTHIGGGQFGKSKDEPTHVSRNGQLVMMEESLRDWFKSRSTDGKKGWVQVGGRYDGKPCARQPGQTSTPKCRSSSERAGMSKKEKEYAFKKKQREDPNQPEKSGAAKPTMVKTYKHQKESYEMDKKTLQEKKDACYSKVKSRYKVWPSAYASGALVKCRKVGADNWGNKSVDENFEDYISKSSNREEGTNSIAKIYKKMTPGQKKLAQEDNTIPRGGIGNSGIGPETTVYRPMVASGYGGAGTIPMYESIMQWVMSPVTQQRFIDKYGDRAKEKLVEAAQRLSDVETNNRGLKFFTHLREAFAAAPYKSTYGDMSMMPNQGKEEMSEEEKVVDLGQKRDDKNLRAFHKSIMSRIGETAKKMSELVSAHREAGRLPFEVGSRFSTEHSRKNKLPPMKVIGYYVNPKNPDNDYGYHVERRTGSSEDDVEQSTIALKHPGLEKLHGPEKWANLVAGFQPVGKLKSIKESEDVIKPSKSLKGYKKHIHPMSNFEKKSLKEASSTPRQMPANLGGDTGSKKITDFGAQAFRGAGDTARGVIDRRLFNRTTDKEYDKLIRATHAETSPKGSSRESSGEHAGIALSIANRAARQGGREGSINSVLTARNQFQAVTGTKKNPGPSREFREGPSSERKKDIENAIVQQGSSIPSNQVNFTAADKKAYKSGTDISWRTKLLKTGEVVGGSVFGTRRKADAEPGRVANWSDPSSTAKSEPKRADDNTLGYRPSQGFRPSASQTPAAPKVPEAPKPEAPKVPEAPKTSTRTVARGDTVARIMRDSGMTLDQFRAANPNLKNINRIDVGQQLNVNARPSTNRTPETPSVPAAPKAPAAPKSSTSGAVIADPNKDFGDQVGAWMQNWVDGQMRARQQRQQPAASTAPSARTNPSSSGGALSPEPMKKPQGPDATLGSQRTLRAPEPRVDNSAQQDDDAEKVRRETGAAAASAIRSADPVVSRMDPEMRKALTEPKGKANIFTGSRYGDQGIDEEAPAWQRKEGKNQEGGLNRKGVESYRRENPGSKLQTAVTTEPSKLKKGSKSAKRRLSFCRRMKGMKAKLTSAKTARDPDSRINKSLRKWNCEE